jgi:hypothetical protein
MPGRSCRPADANLHAVNSINGIANQDGGRNRQHTGPRVSTGIFFRKGLSTDRALAEGVRCIRGRKPPLT